MLPLEITINEINILKGYKMLGMSYQNAFEDYLRYMLARQYRMDVNKAIFGNARLNNQVKNLVLAIEEEKFEPQEVKTKAGKVLEYYFSLLSEVHCRYEELVPELDCNDKVRTLGVLAADNITRACDLGNLDIIRMEIRDFYATFERFAKNNTHSD